MWSGSGDVGVRPTSYVSSTWHVGQCVMPLRLAR